MECDLLRTILKNYRENIFTDFNFTFNKKKSLCTILYYIIILMKKLMLISSYTT